MYVSNAFLLIIRLFPTHKTKEQLSLFEISLILLIPIPEYAAVSSTVKFAFSQIGTSIFLLLNKNHPPNILNLFTKGTAKQQQYLDFFILHCHNKVYTKFHALYPYKYLVMSPYMQRTKLQIY